MKRNILFCIVIMFSASNILAQNAIETRDKIAVIPHTGQMQYQMLLYSIPDIDFPWDLSATYNSSALKPLNYSGILGNNWQPNFSGSITRIVMGLPDDQYYGYNSMGETPTGDLSKPGYYVYVSNNYNSSEPKLTLSEANNPSSYLYNQVDLMPDIFDFQFGQYAGRFIIGYDGKAQIISGDFVDVDLSQFTLQTTYHSNYFQPAISTIKLTTNDGYTYIFGGTIESIEHAYTISSQNGNFALCNSAPVITSWFLTQIIAANGRIMNFYYHKTQEDPDTNTLYHSIISNKMTCNQTEVDAFASTNLDIYSIFARRDTILSDIISSVCLQKQVALDSISIPDIHFRFAITYNYFTDVNTTNNVFYGINPNKSLGITQVRATINNQQLCIWNFSQILAKMGTQKCRILTKIESPIEQYTYTYDTLHAYTIHDDLGADLDIYGQYMQNPSLFCLREINSPFGKKTVINYGRSVCDSIRIFSDLTHTFINQVNSNTLSYGINVSSIAIYDHSNNLMLKKRYYYGDADITNYEENPETPILRSPINADNSELWEGLDSGTGVTQSSGIINIDYASINGNNTYMIFPDLVIQAKNFNIIEYSKVQEYIYDNSSSAPLTMNCYYYNTTQNQHQQDYTPINTFPILKNYIYADNSLIRNNLIRQDVYQGEQLVKQNTIKNKHITGNNYWIARTEAFHYTIPYCVNKEITTQTTSFRNNTEITSTLFNRLDAKGRCIKQTSALGQDSIMQLYVYPDDLMEGTDQVCDTFSYAIRYLVNAHKIQAPIETITKKYSHGQWYVISGFLQYYRPAGNIIPCGFNPGGGILMAPPGNSNIITGYGVEYSLDLAEPLTNFQLINIDDGHTTYDSHYSRKQTMTYGLWNRLTTVTGIDNMTKSYQWDETYTNIIKEQCGYAYTLYTYRPFIGVASTENERGIKTYYEYDSFGKLIEIYQLIDGHKNILKKIYYHYSTNY